MVEDLDDASRSKELEVPGRVGHFSRGLQGCRSGADLPKYRGSLRNVPLAAPFTSIP